MAEKRQIIGFIMTPSGKAIERCVANVVKALTANDWKGVIAFDEFRQNIILVRPAPFIGSDASVKRDSDVWTDTDTTRLQYALAVNYTLIASREMVDTAVESVAHKNRLHPIQAWFGGLKWDKKKRLDRLFIDYFGATDTEYTRGIARCWMVSAVARTFEPGCQADYLVVLKGPQGVGKTKGLRALFSTDWFSETTLDLDSKDAILALMGKLCVCFDELDSIRGKARTEKVKNFLTRTFDNVRVPYARRNIDIPRRAIFAGTTNEDGFLTDTTGNRRFGPVECTTVNVKRIMRDRAQLWAEAVSMYHQGVEWWPSVKLSEMVEETQRGSLQRHVWEEPIARWCGANEEHLKGVGVSCMRLLTEVVGKMVGQCTNADLQVVGLTMKRLGWSKGRRASKGVQEWRYFPPSRHVSDAVAPKASN